MHNTSRTEASFFKVMKMTLQNSNYFLGRIFDPKAGALTNDPLLLDPSNLTTHAVVTGMTGSGKTGLCIGMLEEAALHGTPAIIIDPKGDLTNLLLHFPSLLPSDFEPWIDPELARQQGESVPQLAQETADKWRKGLADWGMGPEQIQLLADSAEFQIYTPRLDSRHAGEHCFFLRGTGTPLGGKQRGAARAYQQHGNRTTGSDRYDRHRLRCAPVSTFSSPILLRLPGSKASRYRSPT